MYKYILLVFAIGACNGIGIEITVKGGAGGGDHGGKGHGGLGHGGPPILHSSGGKGWDSGHNYEAVYNYQPVNKGWPPNGGKTALLQSLFPLFVFPKDYHKSGWGWDWRKSWDNTQHFFHEPKVSFWQGGKPHNLRLKKPDNDYHGEYHGWA